MKKEKIWYKDIKVLFEPRKIKKFLPFNSYSKSEKLNSVMRLTLYITILLLITTLNINYLYILIITGLITFLIYSSNEKEKFTNNKEINIEKIKEDPDIKKRDIKVEDYIEDCTLPTDHNPFMNFLVSDKREKKEACKSHNNPEIKELIEDKFNKKLYRDINSVYNNENSQREFYTMPNTEVMNKQKELANWLYKTPKTCKEGNGNQCVGNNMERLNGSSYYFI
tara:strand:+ start:2078 stop:2749 length:672 start_codon:yes stop_codon:yes gene_type:complete